jgi:hypothetical protein
MMCHRDRTFCAGPCAVEDCSRQITAEVTDAASRAGLPLSISDFRSACPDYRRPRAPSPGEGGRR